MTYREEQWLLQTIRENNKMLKYIIRVINYAIADSDNENTKDFLRNIAANMISTHFESNNNKR